jgi:tetratricopeptide (TPR) repeat protein
MSPAVPPRRASQPSGSQPSGLQPSGSQPNSSRPDGSQPQQHNHGLDGGRVLAVQTGTQVNIENLHLTPGQLSTLVRSLTPPYGRRDPARPVRGRDEILAQLEALLPGDDDDGSRVQVLHGLGGCGKTTIALELAHRLTPHGRVWWLDATTGPGLAAGMHALARRLGALANDLEHGASADVLWERLHRYQEKWLLIIDGADRPEFLSAGGSLADGTGWLRPLASGRGLVVITSKDGDGWAPWCRRWPVGMLEVQDAAAMLCDLAPAAGDTSQAKALGERLGGHPLTLRTAGSYLAETAEVPWPGPESITSFTGYSAALAETGTVQVMSQAIDLSLELLTTRGMASGRTVLWLLAGLAKGPVPYRLLLDPRRLGKILAGPDATAAGMWRLLRSLAGLSLIEMEAPPVATGAIPPPVPTATMHPLVRRVSRSWPEDAHARTLVLAKVLLGATEELTVPEEPSGWPLWQALTPHILHVVRQLPASAGPELMERMCDLAATAIRNLRARGMFEAAQHEYQTLLTICGQQFGAGARATLNVRLLLAEVRHYRALYEEAKEEIRAVLAARRGLHGDEHPDTLATRRGLARVLRAEGRYHEAQEELLGVKGIEDRLLGPDYPATLITRHQLARLRHNLGELAEAEQEFWEVLEARRRVLGPDHPDTLLSWHQLAHVIHRRGRWPAARAAFEQVLTARIALLGLDHPDTLHTRHRRALVLLDQGEAETASAEFQQVLQLRASMLGESHPDTLAVRQSLAEAMLAHGERTAAIAELRRVYSVRCSVLGPQHPETLVSAALLEKATAEPA